jgi:F-type H+-transporting ATPase subunit delta
MKVTRQQRQGARRLFRLCMEDGHVDPARVRQVTARLATAGRRGSLAILSEFLRAVRLDRDRRAATVESAASLPPDVREQIVADLVRIYGSGLDASFDENPALIGGMRIRVGSDVYDDSVRARLASIEARL